MTREEIETKIRGVERMIAVERDMSTLATLNRCLEHLIMLDADDENEKRMPAACPEG